MFRAVATLPDAGRTGKCSLEIGFRERFGMNPIRSDRLTDQFCHRHVSLSGFAVEPALVFRVDIDYCSRHKAMRYYLMLKKIPCSGERDNPLDAERRIQ